MDRSALKGREATRSIHRRAGLKLHVTDLGVVGALLRFGSHKCSRTRSDLNQTDVPCGDGQRRSGDLKSEEPGNGHSGFFRGAPQFRFELKPNSA